MKNRVIGAILRKYLLVNWCHSSGMSVDKGVVVKLFLLPYRCSYDTIITDCDICVSSVPYS